jgi:hypothetical protein
LDGKEHRVLLLFALRADKPWALNRRVVPVPVHIRRQIAQVCVFHPANRSNKVETHDGRVSLAQLLNYVHDAGGVRFNQAFETVTHTP